MSSSEANPKWDYKCPQFCDFTAPETWSQNQDVDSFFAVDHERDRRQSSYGDNSFNIEIMRTNDKPLNDKPLNGSQTDCCDGIDVNEDQKGSIDSSHKYQTPPQNLNKENINDNEDNDVFYSTKKSFTIEKKCGSYKLRSTPMRTLQYNGVTPLRETRITSSKKKKNNRSKHNSVDKEMAFNMKSLVESLPTCVEPISETVVNNSESETTFDSKQNHINQETQSQNVDKENEINWNEDNVDNGIEPTVEASNEMPTTGRASYVIESRVQKTVTLISPVKSAKMMGSVNRFRNSNREKGTPIRRSIAQKGAQRQPLRTQSVSSSLYSAVKNTSTKYKSMAELINEFETKPRGYDRSRSMDRTTCTERSRSSSVSSLTRPVSPKLHSIHRHRCITSQAERDEMIAQEIKKYSFKANPIRKKLFDAKFASGIPRIKSVKAPTKAIGMHFMTEKRNQMRSAKLSTEQESEKPRFKANPMPTFKNPLHVFHQKSAKKVTAFKPFSFDDRNKNALIKRQQSLESIQKNNQNATHFNDKRSFKF